MTKKGIVKLVVCMAVFALSLSMFFQSWFHLNKDNFVGSLVNIVDSNNRQNGNIITGVINAFDGHDKESDNVSDGAPEWSISRIIKYVINTVYDILIDNINKLVDNIDQLLYLSPQKVTQSVKFISYITEIGSDTIDEMPLVGMVVNMNPAIIKRTALLFEVFEYAIYITAGIAFASIVMDRTIGILPYVLLLCAYPLVVIKKIPFVGKVLSLTPYAILGIGLGIILLILSIAVRDKKRYALRREAKKMKRWVYI